MGDVLGPIQFRCDLSGLPTLTTIFVSWVTGLRGARSLYATSGDLTWAQLKVLRHHWFKTGNPAKLADAARVNLSNVMKHPGPERIC